MCYPFPLISLGPLGTLNGSNNLFDHTGRHGRANTLIASTPSKPLDLPARTPSSSRLEASLLSKSLELSVPIAFPSVLDQLSQAFGLHRVCCKQSRNMMIFLSSPRNRSSTIRDAQFLKYMPLLKNAFSKRSPMRTPSYFSDNAVERFVSVGMIETRISKELRPLYAVHHEVVFGHKIASRPLEKAHVA